MSAQKRFIPFFVATVSVIFVLACQSVSRILSPAIPANTPAESSSISSSYDGDWKGKTSQGSEITFTVAHDEIRKMNFQAEWKGMNCSRTIETNMETTINPTAEATGNFTPVHPVENGSFTVAQDNSGVDGTAYTFIGAFSSPDSATGTMEYKVTTGSCQGTKKFDWTATKVSK